MIESFEIDERKAVRRTEVDVDRTDVFAREVRVARLEEGGQVRVGRNEPTIVEVLFQLSHSVEVESEKTQCDHSEEDLHTTFLCSINH